MKRNLREIQLAMEQELALKALEKVQMNPNLELHKIQNTIDHVNRKLEPLMSQVDQQLNNVGLTKRLSD